MKIITKNIKLLILIFSLISLCYLFFIFNTYNLRIFSTSHILPDFEISSFFLALFIGILTFVRYVSNKSTSYLFISAGFAGLACIHFANFCFNSSFLSVYLPSSLYSTASWSWFNSSLFLSLFLITGVSIEKFNKTNFLLNKKTELTVYLLSLLIVGLNCFVFFFIPLTNLYNSELQYLPVLGFAYIFLMNLTMQRWLSSNFNYYFLLAVLVLFICQFFMLFSKEIFDGMFNLSHILRIFSYSLVLIGTFVSIYETYKQEKYNEEKINSILNKMADGVMTVSSNCMITSANPSIEKMFGYSTEELIGQKLSLIIPHKCYNRVKNIFCKGECFVKRITQSIGSTGSHKNGKQIPIEISINEIDFYGEKLFVLVIRDITQRKKVENMKNEFISTVSHELRTPLTSIKGSLGLIAAGGVGQIPDAAKSLLDIAINNSNRLILLINDILDIEKIEAGKMKFDINAYSLTPLIEQSIIINNPYAEQFKIHFDFKQPQHDIEVEVDKDRLIQVLTNLLSNAAKFSLENSTVTISVKHKDSFVRVSVTDNGHGIPEEFKGNIFKKFAQADSSDTRQKGGTGLGLNISKAIIEKLGGSIGFESVEGKGTTFYFELPTINQSKADIKPRILICEDDVNVASYISEVLTQNDYIVDKAHTAEDAKNLLLTNDYDAITLDILLPDNDGISMIKETNMSKNIQDLPIVVVSVTSKEDCDQEFITTFTLLEWFNKPFGNKKLIQAIQKGIKNKRKIKILHIEDDKDIQTIIQSILSINAEITQVASYAEAKKLLENEVFDIVLLDIELPDGNGLNLLPVINKSADKNIATVIFSAQEVDKNIENEVEAVLLKSRTENDVLVKKINKIIENQRNIV